MNKLVGFGASTMEGAGDSQGGFLLRFKTKLAQAGQPYDVINLGRGGQTTQQMVSRLAEAQALQADQAVLLLGCNDLPRERDADPEARVALDDYARNLEKIFAAFLAAETVFISSFAVCPQRTGVSPEIFASYMRRALEKADAAGLRTWNLHEESLGWGDRYWAPDGLHYADAGHEMIASRVAEFFGPV